MNDVFRRRTFLYLGYHKFILQCNVIVSNNVQKVISHDVQQQKIEAYGSYVATSKTESLQRLTMKMTIYCTIHLCFPI